MLLLQLSIPQLRSGSAIRNLNLELEAVAFDLKKWRWVSSPLLLLCHTSLCHHTRLVDVRAAGFASGPPLRGQDCLQTGGQSAGLYADPAPRLLICCSCGPQVW